MKPSFELFGLPWPGDYTELDAIIYCIRHGGLFKDERHGDVGAPLWQLYRRMQSYLWPDDDHHEWSDLMLRTIIENRITAIQGPKDCSKTHTMAKYGLTDYFCFPNETLTLLSSTDLRGLELRVWGDLKDLFVRARDKWPEVPGHPMDSLHGIFTDRLEEDMDVRDIRKGLICIPTVEANGQWKGLERYTGIKQKRRRLLGDECFPAGTPVLTPFGYRAIECIQPGDTILNAIGQDTVLGTRKSVAKRLCRLVLRDGREVWCTPTHKFLTVSGWMKAIDINRGQYILSPYEGMSILSHHVRALRQAEAVRCLSLSANSMPILREVLCAREAQQAPDFLLHELQGKMGLSAAGSESEVLFRGPEPQGEQGQVGVASYPPEVRRWFVGEDDKEQSDARTTISWSLLGIRFPQELFRGSHSTRSGAVAAIKERKARMEHGDSHWQKHAPFLLPGRCGVAFNSARCGSRWPQPLQSKSTSKGRAEGRFLEGAWVDSCTLHESSDYEATRTGEGGVAVYNLHVARHHSYSVVGLLCMNCQFMEAPYLTSLANLNKIRSDFKGVFVGNPVGQGDPLDQLAEPKEGWDSLGEISTTMTWKNRMNGVTVQLYGPDSPANKNPGKYTYLLDQSDIDYIVEYWGKESAEYWNQAAGIRQPGVSQRRIVTRDMAAKFHAQDPVVWRGGPTVRIYAIDAGYGGDRCIGGWGEYGQDINGKQVLNIVPPVAIPIRVFPKSVPEAERVSAEDQIADFTRAACMVNDIPAERVFHDATGRGSLGTAFARLWRSGSTPVEFGGRPTERPVMADLYLFDEKIRQRRLIRCDEHYDRRVSELAFNVRYVIESGQMRGLPNDVLDELCAREWKRTKNGKIQVELKEEAKERLGRSPDKADWCAILVEGARQCGFQIARLQSEDVAIAEEDTRWREALQDRATRLRKSYSLTYS